MPVSADTLAVLMEKGLSGEHLLDVVRAIDDDASLVQAIKTKRQERNHRYYEKRKAREASENVSIQASESDVLKPSPKEKSPTPPKEITPSSSLRSDSLVAREAFDGRFWPAYPNKVGRPAAERAFGKAFRDLGGDVEPLLDGLARYVATKPADRSWLNPSTFLNQRRWEDVPGTPPARAGPAARQPTLAEMSRMDEPGFSFDDPPAGPRSPDRHAPPRFGDVPPEGASAGDARRSGFAGRLSVADRDDRRSHVVDL